MNAIRSAIAALLDNIGVSIAVFGARLAPQEPVTPLVDELADRAHILATEARLALYDVLDEAENERERLHNETKYLFRSLDLVEDRQDEVNTLVQTTSERLAALNGVLE